MRSLDVAEEFDKYDEEFLESFAQKLFACLSMYGYFARGTCFVIMPFAPELADIYFTIIKPTVQSLNFICRREDEHSPIGLLTPGIVSHIANATFIVADITGNNPNVFYELGIAHTLEKFVILLSQTDAPSDIRHWKYIHYRNRAGEAKRIADNLRAAIHEALEAGTINVSRQRPMALGLGDDLYDQ